MDIKCTQCGAKVPIEQDTGFIRCPYCETSLYVDTDRTVKHFSMSPQIRPADLAPVIQRKLSYMEIKDPVKVGRHNLVYFPFWRLDMEGGFSITVPASPPVIEDIIQIKCPAGDLKLFAPELAAEEEVVEPQALLEDAVADAAKLMDNKEPKFSAASLLHLPMYAVEYACGGARHKALVEAVSGEVYADDWPAAPQKEKDRVLGMIAALAFGLFFLEAALLPGLWPVLAAYAVTAIAIYYLARRTLTKMGW